MADLQLLEEDEDLCSLCDDIELLFADASQGKGKVVLTSKRMLWLSAEDVDGDTRPPYSVVFDDIIMHAISRDGGFPPCLYMQIDTGEYFSGDEQDAARIAEQSTNGVPGLCNADPLTFVKPTEVRLVPGEGTELDALFEQFCEASSVAPASDGEGPEGNFFFNDEAIMQGMDNAMKRKLQEYEDKLVIEGEIEAGEDQEAEAEEKRPRRLLGVQQ